MGIYRGGAARYETRRDRAYTATEDDAMTAAYEPPRVWTWERENGGTFASINRPVSGATHEAAPTSCSSIRWRRPTA